MMRIATKWWALCGILIITCFLNLTMFSMFCFYPTPDLKGQLTNILDYKQLVILVMTAPANYERRQVIRQTWLSKLNTEKAKVYFVLGSGNLDRDTRNDLSAEQSAHSDLMIIDTLEDSYFKLTEKILEGLSVAVREHNFTYVMKCDDDTFIDGSKLLEKLQSLPTSRLYLGYFTGAAHVKIQGQWAEPNYHLCDRYLPYARGGGYIVTRDLAEFIITNRELLQIYNSEDVTVGIWLAPLDITRLHDTGFDTEASSRGCQNHHIVSHKQTVEDMRTKHTSLETSGKLCKREVRRRPEYIYNWGVPPSKCCSNI